MSTMLSTQNPQAAERLGNPLPMPRQAEWVLFWPRPNEIRMGMKSVPALVLKSDQENGTLDLLVVMDVDDMLHLHSIPPHIENDRGWTRLESQAQAFESEALRMLADFKGELGDVLFGAGVEKPEQPLLGLISGLATQYTALSARVKAMEDFLNSLPPEALMPAPANPKSKPKTK